jgi:hypothetical protein
LQQPVSLNFIAAHGASVNTVQGNYIGTNAAGTAALGNKADGVFVEVQSITHSVQDNRIAFNTNAGVRIPNITNNPGTPGVRIEIVDNAIFANGTLGIDLGDSGITANDPLDVDAGANLQRTFPVLTSFSFLRGNDETPAPASPAPARTG